jgi:predicted transcriptional regulator
MGWLFLYLHQLVYEKTAMTFPDTAGMPGKTRQQIQTVVNHDINALSVAKFGHEKLSKNDRKNNKVCLLPFGKG